MSVRNLARPLLVGVCILSLAACGAADSAPASGNSPVDEDRVSAAQEIADGYAARPTTIEGLEPIAGDIPSGKKVYYLALETPSRLAGVAALEEAAGHLGWEVEALLSDGSAAEVKDHFETAFRDGADAIIEQYDSSLVNTSLAEAKAQGIPVVGISQDLPAGEELIYAAITPDHVNRYGEAWASWITADSEAQAHVLYVVLAGVPVFEATLEAFKDEIDGLCGPECSVETLGLPPTATANEIPNLITSALRANPELNYVVMPVHAHANGLPAALGSAGLEDRVTLLGANGVTTTYQYILDGQSALDIPLPSYEMFYLSIDAFARHFAGEEISQIQPPIWTVTKDEVPEEALRGIFPEIPDVESFFVELWGK